MGKRKKVWWGEEENEWKIGKGVDTGGGEEEEEEKEVEN